MFTKNGQGKEPEENNLYTNAGFDTYLLVITSSTTADDVATILKRCQDIGMDVMIRLHTDLVKWNLTDTDTSDYSEFYNVFTDHQAFANFDFTQYSCLKGFFIVDEPSWSQLEVIAAEYVPWFNNLVATTGREFEFFVNLFSGYSTNLGALRDINGVKLPGNLYDGVNATLTAQQKADFVKAYHNFYLTEILATVNSVNKIFSHDAYPFFDNQEGKINLVNSNATAEEKLSAQKIVENYLAIVDEDGNMTMGFTENDFLTEIPDGYEYSVKDEWLSRSLNIAIQARDNGYGYGAHIQVFDEGGANRPKATWRLPTTLAEVRWQVYMNLAMGAKRIDYFGFGQSKSGSYMTLGTAALPIYSFVQQTNAELKSVDHVFASFETWVGIKTFTPAGAQMSAGFQMVAEKGQNLESLTNVLSVTTSRELVIGEMVDGNGNHGYMLVGYEDPLNGNSTSVEMTFDGAEGFIVYRGGERTLVEAIDGVFSVTLEAGDGVFVIPVYAEYSEYFEL